MANVRPVAAADRSATVGAITDAFSRDPVVRWCFRDDTTYPVRATAFFGYLFDVRLAVDGGWVPPWRSRGSKRHRLEGVLSVVPQMRYRRPNFGVAREVSRSGT